MKISKQQSILVFFGFFSIINPLLSNNILENSQPSCNTTDAINEYLKPFKNKKDLENFLDLAIKKIDQQFRNQHFSSPFYLYVDEKGVFSFFSHITLRARATIYNYFGKEENIPYTKSLTTYKKVNIFCSEFKNYNVILTASQKIKCLCYLLQTLKEYEEKLIRQNEKIVIEKNFEKNNQLSLPIKILGHGAIMLMGAITVAIPVILLKKYFLIS